MNILNIGQHLVQPENIVSYELLETTQDVIDTYKPLQTSLLKGETLIDTYTHIVVVKDLILKYKNDVSLEALLGHVSMEAIEKTERHWFTRFSTWLSDFRDASSRWVESLYKRTYPWEAECDRAYWLLKRKEFDNSKYELISGNDLVAYLTPKSKNSTLFAGDWEFNEREPKVQTVKAVEVQDSLKYIISRLVYFRQAHFFNKEWFDGIITETKAAASSDDIDKAKYKDKLVELKKELKQAHRNMSELGGRLVQQASSYCKLSRAAQWSKERTSSSSEALTPVQKAIKLKASNTIKKMLNVTNAWADDLWGQSVQWEKACIKASIGLEHANFKGKTYNLICGDNGEDLLDYLYTKGTDKLLTIDKWEFSEHVPKKQNVTWTEVRDILMLIAERLKHMHKLKKEISDWYKNITSTLENISGEEKGYSKTINDLLIKYKEKLKESQKAISKLTDRLIEQAKVYCAVAEDGKARSND